MTGGVHEHMRAWEPEEDTIIIHLIGELGPKWSRIVQQLPGRSVSSVRNRWQRIEKGRKLRETGQESKNRCQRCGHPKRGHVCTAKLKGRGEASDSASVASEDVGTDSEMPLVRRSSSADSTPFPSDAVAAACDSPRGCSTGPPTPGRRRESFGATVVYDSAAAASSYSYIQPPYAHAPLLGRMRSEGRICSELGFEALAAAASLQLAAQAAELLHHMPLPIAKQMSATPHVPPLATMPSLMHMSSFETFANAERLAVYDDVPPVETASLVEEEPYETRRGLAALLSATALPAAALPAAQPRGAARLHRDAAADREYVAPPELEATVSSSASSCEG